MSPGGLRPARLRGWVRLDVLEDLTPEQWREHELRSIGPEIIATPEYKRAPGRASHPRECGADDHRELRRATFAGPT